MSAIAALPNVGSQIERAMVAYFKDAFATRASEVNFYVSNDWKRRIPPCLTVLAAHSTEEPKFTMDKDFLVKVEASWKGNNEIGEQNPDSNRVYIDWLIGVAEAAMSQSDNGQDRQATCTAINLFGRKLAGLVANGGSAATQQDADNDADMVNFTCLRIESAGDQRAEKGDDGSFILREVRNFRVSACPINVD